MLVEVDKSYKGLDLGHVLWGRPVTNTGHLDGVHFYVTFLNDEAEILHHALLKCALGLEVKQMSVEDVEDPYYNGMVLLLGLPTEYEDVIHINNYDSLVNEFSEDLIHHCLEHLWAVSET